MEFDVLNTVWISFWIVVVSVISQNLVIEKMKEGNPIDFKAKLMIALACVLFFIWFFFGKIPIMTID